MQNTHLMELDEFVVAESKIFYVREDWKRIWKYLYLLQRWKANIHDNDHVQSIQDMFAFTFSNATIFKKQFLEFSYDLFTQRFVSML